MINPYKKNAKLVLSNGIVFPGFYFGAYGTAIGEIVFNTGMTGYQEVITDPSYYGQILTFTYPEIGNTGINFEDSESNTNVKGIIVRNFSSNNSNWRSKKNFDQWLVEKNTPSGLLDRTSFIEDREGKTKTSQPWDTSLFRIEFLIPKSIATIFNFLEDSAFLILKSKLVCVCVFHKYFCFVETTFDKFNPSIFGVS